MTDKRLLCVASLVRDKAKLADIGTDHAYLPVHLMQTGRIVSAVAADIGEGPAASARQHIAEAGLSGCMDVRVCDGLQGISPEEVTDIVIAGMGGETIIHILHNAPWVRSADIRLVLQPMTKSVELRRWLYQNGFVIDEEHIVLDGRHLYVAMAVSFDGGEPPSDPLMPFVGALRPDATSRPYIDQQCTYLTHKIEGLRCADRAEEAAALQAILQRLNQFITEE